MIQSVSAKATERKQLRSFDVVSERISNVEPLASERLRFFRSPIELDAVWNHLRKFTRLKDDQDKWCMVRFWDPYIFWQGVAFGNQLYAELLKPLSFGISCRAV